jgi:hypothetical protein
MQMRFLTHNDVTHTDVVITIQRIRDIMTAATATVARS